MVHAYHLIWGTYGFWMPNDPRGSWSDFVASWELARFGKTTKTIDRAKIALERWDNWRLETNRSLKYPPVEISGNQAKLVGEGFGDAVRKSGYCIWACSILPQHVHLVLARHSYSAEKVTNLLKGAATKSLANSGLHPQAKYRQNDGRLPSLWSLGQWKVFLDTENAIENAIRYVEENPTKEGLPEQKWSFVTRYDGLKSGGFVTYL
jgi:REP element-mobilizing transposase RayT